MFASRVATYNNDALVGTKATTAVASFERDRPLYRAIAELAGLRTTQAALRRGAQIVRNYSVEPGLFAVSRLDPQSGREIVIAINTSNAPLTAQVEVDSGSLHFTALHGSCAAAPSAPGSYAVSLAPLDYVVCAAGAGP
jgi:streptogramin lyase